MHDLPHSDRAQKLRSVGSRRRHRYSHICTLTSALSLLLSVSLLYYLLSSNEDVSKHQQAYYDELSTNQQNPLLYDTDDGSDPASFDQIDELDFAETEKKDEDNDPSLLQPKKMVTSSYYVDHVTGVIRRASNKRSIDDWDYDYGEAEPFAQMFVAKEVIGAVGSDDVVIDADVREKIGLVKTIEDALLLKVGTRGNVGLRTRWGDWFEKKGDFLRRDRMFRSNLEAMNPLNNPMLQDSDGTVLSGLTRGDKAIQKWYINQLKNAPPLVKKNKQEVNYGSRTLLRKLLSKSKHQILNRMTSNMLRENDDKRGKRKYKAHSNETTNVYANGRRWGYYPGLDAKMPFSNFVRSFFERSCEVKVFMIWNSPTWMFRVKHQRSIESLLTIHSDACVLMLSETMELDFFKDSFLKKGFKVAVAHPNLDELLKDTPAHVFSSRLRRWKITKLYPKHYSELVRLAALYQYGGIYLDSDVLVMHPINSLDNAVGLSDGSLHGAVMAFRKRSPFLMECIEEFAATYREDDVGWNGAQLLKRVANTFSDGKIAIDAQPSFTSFPISTKDVVRYFYKPDNESERAEQDGLFEHIVSSSLTVHLWNGLTSSIVPETGSVVAKLIDRSCIFCLDIL